MSISISVISLSLITYSVRKKGGKYKIRFRRHFPDIAATEMSQQICNIVILVAQYFNKIIFPVYFLTFSLPKVLKAKVTGPASMFYS